MPNKLVSIKETTYNRLKARLRVIPGQDKIVLKANAELCEVIGFSKVGNRELWVNTNKGGIQIKGRPDQIEFNFVLLCNAFRMVSLCSHEDRP